MSNGQATECDDDISPRGSRWGCSTFTALPLWARPNPTLDRGTSLAPQAVKVTHINTHIHIHIKLVAVFACAPERGCEIGIFTARAKVYWAGIGTDGQGGTGLGKIARKHLGWVMGDWVGWGVGKKKKRARERERNQWMGGFIKLPLFSLSVAWHHSGIGAISQPLAESQFIHKAWTAASAPNDAMIQQSRQPDPTNKGQYAFYHAIEL